METRMNAGGAVRVGAWRDGEQDDLVMALALACWRARWKRREMFQSRSFGLGRSQLPGRRVELYREICEVFLRDSLLSGPEADLKSACKQDCLPHNGQIVK